MLVRRMGTAAMEGAALIRLLVILCSLVGTANASADDRPTVIIVVGAEGTPEYGRDFATWADRWKQAAAKGSAKVQEIGRDSPSTSKPSMVPATKPTLTDKDTLRDLLKSVAGESSGES